MQLLVASVFEAGTGRAVVVSGSVAELYSRYYDADFFEEDALGAEVQRVSTAVLMQLL
jgi:hypothetical protein